MTRKDYEKFAMELKHRKPFESDEHPTHYRVRLDQWRLDVQCVSNVLKSDNPRFDMQRFLNACDY